MTTTNIATIAAFMMKVKTAELTGAALDWAVHKCEVLNQISSQEQADSIALARTRLGYSPSGNWAVGGMIIEREGISVVRRLVGLDDDGNRVCDGWTATYSPSNNLMHGSTLLIAAMRCYARSKLGKEVDVPEELL